MVDGAHAGVSLLATLEQPVDFGGAEVDLVMLVIGCEHNHTGHLAALSSASKHLRISSEYLRKAAYDTELRHALGGSTVAA